MLPGLDTEKDDYYQLFIPCLEQAAEEKGIVRMEIYTDKQLVDMI